MTRPAARATAVLLGLFMALVGAVPARAGDRITRGDAETALGALLPAFWRAAAGPANALDVEILPFQAPGRHYCTLDWHTIQLSLLVLDGDLLTHQAELAYFDASSVSFTLDGAALASRTGPVKRLHLSDLSGFGRTWGLLVAPGSLSPGEHVLVATVSAPAIPPDVPGGTDVLQTTFVIDPSGEGACL
jgi:hypothetical protein